MRLFLEGTQAPAAAALNRRCSRMSVCSSPMVYYALLDSCCSSLLVPCLLVTCELIRQSGSSATRLSNFGYVCSHLVIWALLTSNLSAGPVIVVGIALGIAAVSQAGGTHLNDSHKVRYLAPPWCSPVSRYCQKWGIALLVLYLLQCGSGAFIHWVKPKVSRGRPAQNYFHAVIGLLIIGLAFYQVRTGFRNEWPSTTGRGALPNGVNIIWYVWVVVRAVFSARISWSKPYTAVAPPLCCWTRSPSSSIQAGSSVSFERSVWCIFNGWGGKS